MQGEGCDGVGVGVGVGAGGVQGGAGVPGVVLVGWKMGEEGWIEWGDRGVGKELPDANGG